MPNFKKNIIFILIFFIGFFCVSDASAFQIQTLENMLIKNDIVLSPSKTELFLNPGEHAVKNLKITNRTGKLINVFIEIEDFTGDSYGSSKLLGKEKGIFSLRDYLYPEQNNFILAHGEKAVLPINVNIPQNAEPGGLYGAVIVRAEPVVIDKADAIEQITVKTRLASLFFARVKGDVNEIGNLKSFQSDRKFYNKNNINFSIVYNNTGNVHLNPYGKIEIKNILGKKIDEIQIAPYFVMPGFFRAKNIIWDKNLAFGRYTAFLQLNRGYSNIVDEVKIHFWIMPFKFLFVCGIMLLIILISLWLKRNGSPFARG